MKLLVLLAAIFVTGCSFGVTQEDENRSQNESLSTLDKSKTTVAVGILEAPETSPETKHTAQESATSSSQRSQTTVKVIVPGSTPKVTMTPLPPAPRSPDGIRVAGNRNTVVLGDVHLHHHEHKHYHQAPKLHPVRFDVRVELGDRINEREWRRRMMEARIVRFFPRYGK